MLVIMRLKKFNSSTTTTFFYQLISDHGNTLGKLDLGDGDKGYAKDTSAFEDDNIIYTVLK